MTPRPIDQVLKGMSDAQVRNELGFIIGIVVAGTDRRLAPGELPSEALLAYVRDLEARAGHHPKGFDRLSQST